jgi:hypothetical protein
MRVRAVTAALLGVSIVLAAWQPVAAQEPARTKSSQAPPLKLNDAGEAIGSAVSQLAGQLMLHPAQPSKAADRVAGLYMIEVSTGLVTLIADQQDASTKFCGSPSWSNDGRRILFDAMRPDEVQRAHMKAIELIAGQLTVTDLGVGNCPTFSPAGDEIAFLLNYGGIPGAQGGVWLMRADGSQRRRLGAWGRPRWSPDGRQFMLINFDIPAQVTLMDIKTQQTSPLQLPGMQIYSVPNWASDGTILTVVGAGFGDAIAFVDVTNPAHGKVKEILWKMNFKGPGIGVNPHSPAYAAGSRCCVFIGGAREGMALYSFKRGQADPPKRLEPVGYDSLLQDVALSPDGRYALFSSNRTGPRQR